jgi:putative ABC transport system permease protein
MHYLMQQAFWQDQMAANFVVALAGLGMFLAAIGLYGVIAFVVDKRRHEIGVRMALAAERRDVLGIVLGHGLRIAAVGAGLGLVASLAATRLLSSVLYGVKPTDGLTFFGSSAGAVLVGGCCKLFPGKTRGAGRPYGVAAA